MVREYSVASFYTRMRSAANVSSSSPVLIFPSATDTDSLCALKIATHVLASDSLRYSCYPVSCFGDIDGIAGRQLSSQDQALTVFLINWGCSQDLRQLLKLGPSVQVFVVDSHRPIHLHNLSDQNQQVVVLYTREDESQADIAYDFDVAELANMMDLDNDDEIMIESESDDSDSDEDNDDGGGQRRKRRKLDDSDDDNGLDALKTLKKLKTAYYGPGTYYGRPSGCLMFDMAHALHKSTNELLWLACVSLTDQFVHERVTNERYQAGVMELEQHVNSAGNLEMITSVTLKDGTKVRVPDVSRISYEDEPRLMLLREWTLFDSMLCSSYVATKLKTWSDNGLKKLKLLLAKMGIALVDCQQKFQYMSNAMKKRMKDEFERFLPEYGLNEFYYRSFQRLHGYSSKVSAADVVYGVTALLESSTDSKDSWAEKFWSAYSALSLNHLDELQKGMQLAIRVQCATQRQGSLAITRHGFIKSARSFRWVKLEDGADAELLAYPQAIVKFCYFLMDALREKGAKTKPMICAAIIPHSKMVLVVGVANRPILGAQQGNRFGLAFRATAKELGADYRHDAFESSWIKLDLTAVNSFMLRISEKL
ncbi:hypothetical protein SUGI_0520350 [Cryptomeria japonica]|uniref:cell division control protein 45 homolog n=1 Tax=Cryptomeria japonica TaxID=3369 RepID=UPI0024089F6A|nr:cell division control protein 45 homolog [Cryptomeria japonica]GLJ26714.1 hypothetical protein SUGI_0520350 [Cryptomeria japonica]